jgi:hypothetical protein
MVIFKSVPPVEPRSRLRSMFYHPATVERARRDPRGSGRGRSSVSRRLDEPGLRRLAGG